MIVQDIKSISASLAFLGSIIMLTIIHAHAASKVTNDFNKQRPVIGHLSEPISNNALALIKQGDQVEIFSFLGLKQNKTWQDVSDIAMRWQSNGTTQTNAININSIPDRIGRLASTAEAIDGIIYVFGGYTVAQDHTEVSTPEVFTYNIQNKQYQHITDMPVPVDDAISMVYQNRYIILVSGWSQDTNVDLVQILDTETLKWSQATKFPGDPLFGHSGGLAGNTMVICDGVKIVPLAEPGRREFRISNSCYRGQIDPSNLTHIDWQAIPAHPGSPLYRSASSGAIVDGVARIVFAAGTENPYNFNGIGYNGVPSEPSNRVFSYDPLNDTWETHTALRFASMDHRKLLFDGEWFYLAGGMRANQTVTSDIVRFKLNTDIEYEIDGVKESIPVR